MQRSEPEKDQERKYCVCQQTYDQNQFMIECDGCREWYHGQCVGVTEQQALQIAKFYCDQCEPNHGPTVFRRHSAIKAQFKDFDDCSLKDGQMTDQKTRNKFDILQILSTFQFASDGVVFKRCSGHDVSVANFQKTGGFNDPVICESQEGLGMKMLAYQTTVRQIVDIIGDDRPVEVMDVGTQESLEGWTLNKWADYYMDITGRAEEDRGALPLLNVISLEFSDSPLAAHVQRPSIVRELDFIDLHWPKSSTTLDFPKVQLYCLMSPRGCWTDFHVDFGGTSVFYHIVRGCKTFLLIRPSAENLRKYEKWCNSADQSSVFFADLVDQCNRVDIHTGHTMFIPSSWIHAVYTSQDSVVIGGNFLHRFSIAEQLGVYQIEERCGTPPIYRFPFFETLNWYAAFNYSNLASFFSLPAVEVAGIHALAQFLRSRIDLLRKHPATKKYSDKMQEKIDFVSECLPRTIKCQQFVFLLDRLDVLMMNRKLKPVKRKAEHHDTAEEDIQQPAIRK